jgi:hypothetical protein
MVASGIEINNDNFERNNCMLRKILYALLVIIIVGVAIGYWQWNKPHRDVNSEKAISVAATDLFKAFDTDSVKAQKLYLDKAIEVKGEVSGVSKLDDNSTSITLKVDEGGTNSVQCLVKELKKEVSAGMQVTIKGICTGFTGDDMMGFKDVKLSDCVVVQ